MLVELPSGQKVWHIGDPHLGRRFENGVPLHRRGQREVRQWKRFIDELNTPCDVNICVGDLFDHPQVSYGVVLRAAQDYLAAASTRPQTDFFVMAGNHDRSRQLGSIGAWELFAQIVRDRRDNLTIVDTHAERVSLGQGSDIVLVPWHWGAPVAEQVEAVADRNLFTEDVHHIVLHHDLEAFGGNTDYMVPAKLIMERFPRCQKIVTGHWHLEGDYKVDGVDVACTGSLEPFTHAEDPNGGTYVSLTLEQLNALDPAELREKCVRVLLRDGEELPTDLDCFQLTAKRIAAIDDDEPSVAEKLGAFDWQAILDEHLKDVPDYVRTFIDERLVVT